MAVSPAKRTPASPELIAALEQDVEFYRTVSAEELAEYGGKWIATQNAQVAVSADTHEDLCRQLKDRGLENVCISYLEDPEYTVIYEVR